METLKINRLDPRAKSIIRAVVLNSLMPILRERNRGDYITHEEIHAATGIEPYSRQWGYLILKMKSVMLDATGIQLHFYKRIGSYKLATHDEQLNKNPERAARLAAKKMRRAKAALSKIPDEELSEKDRAIKYFRVEAMAIREASLREKDDFIKMMRPKRAA